MSYQIVPFQALRIDSLSDLYSIPGATKAGRIYFYMGEPKSLYVCYDGETITRIHPKSYGGLFISAPILTEHTSGIPVALNGETVLTGLEVDFDMPANMQLRYTGDEIRPFRISSRISIDISGNNVDSYYYIGLNGTPIEATKMTHKLAGGGDIVALSTFWLLNLRKNDILQLMLDTETGDSNLTAVNGHLGAFQLD